jgi:uncharacterized phage protein (TIGR01671 family)
MGREIKFRAKSLTTNIFQYGEYYVSEDRIPRGGAEHFIVIHSEYTSGDHILVDEETLGQYTGLKDQNGTEIYEGDIYLSFSYCNGIKTTKHYTEVIFDEITDHDGNSFFGWNIETGDEDLEIAGNIYDNPELLAVK